MRCEEVRESLEEARVEHVPAPIREHLASCKGCEDYARDWRLLRAGWRALAEEPVQKASLGFVARLARRLEEAAETSSAAQEFLERAGRRVVYATVLLALIVLLILVLPSSGPLRGPATAELYLAEPGVIAARSDPIFTDEFPDNYPRAPVSLNGEGEKREKK